MNIFLESPTARMKGWKELRKEVSSLPLEDALRAVARWWKNAPLVNCAWDWTVTPGEWPTPWEFINDGYFCPNSISLLIAHTIILSGIEPSRVALKVIRDTDDMVQKVMVIVDSRYVIGHTKGDVVLLSSFSHIIMEDLDLPVVT